jgi:hypothetical protein
VTSEQRGADLARRVWATLVAVRVVHLDDLAIEGGAGDDRSGRVYFG